MERQHLKFQAVFTRLQTSTHALLGQPSLKANNYKQLSFLDPLLFRFQISKALSELAATRHTHTHTQTYKRQLATNVTRETQYKHLSSKLTRETPTTNLAATGIRERMSSTTIL